MNGQLIERHDSLARQDVPLGNGVAISRLVLQLDDVVFVVEYPDQCLLEGQIHHPRVELRGGNFLEPLLMLVLQRDYLPAVGSAATALEGQVVVENSGEVDCDFLASADLADGLHFIEENLRVRGAGVADWLPACTFPAPEVAPADLIVVALDPVNDDDVFPCAFLLIDQFFSFNVSGRVKHRHTFFWVGLDDKVCSVLGLPQSSSLDHRLQKLFLGEIVAEEDIFKETAGLWRSHVVMQRHGHWLEVDQVEFGLMHSDGEQKLSTQHQNSEESFDAFSHLLGKGFLFTGLIPLLANGVILELLSNVLRSVLGERKLNWVEGFDVISIVVAETGELSSWNVLLKSSSAALVQHCLSHDFQSLGIANKIIFLPSDIIADLPIRLHHQRQLHFSILHFFQLKDIS